MPLTCQETHLYVWEMKMKCMRHQWHQALCDLSRPESAMTDISLSHSMNVSKLARDTNHLSPHVEELSSFKSRFEFPADSKRAQSGPLRDKVSTWLRWARNGRHSLRRCKEAKADNQIRQYCKYSKADNQTRQYWCFTALYQSLSLLTWKGPGSPP